MCANCGFPYAPGHWTEAGANTPSERLRSRFRRAAILQSILPDYGLQAHDDGVTPGMTVMTRTGNQEIVANISEVWSAVERMTGRIVDPLSPRFTGQPEIRNSDGEPTGTP